MTASFAATIVLPTRNEEGSIGRLLQEIATVVDRSLQTLIEVLVIDDSDLTGAGVNPTIEAVETAMHAIHSPNVVIRWHHRPKGYRPGKLSGAMAEGLRRAQGRIRIYMDSDGQHPPAIVPALVEQIEAGHDIVVGSRYCRGGSSDGLDGPLRHIVSRGATAVTKTLFPWALRGVSDPMSGCFAVREGAVDVDQLNPRGFKFLLDLLARHAHLKRTQVPLVFRPRLDGESKAGEGNGVEFLKQVPTLRAQTLPELVSFGSIGVLTSILGAMLLWLLVFLGVNPLVANAIQLVVTLAANFEFYRRHVWPGQQNGHLRWQIPSFLAVRGGVLVLSWYVFAVMIHGGYHYQIANVGGLLAGMILNYPATKVIFDPTLRSKVRSKVQRSQSAGAATTRAEGNGPVRHRAQRTIRWKLKLTVLVLMALLAASIVFAGGRTTLFGFIVLYSLFSFVTSCLEVRWRLYGRRNPEAREAMKFPEPIAARDADLHFFAIVPALDEAAVIGDTLITLMGQRHPNFNIVVSLAQGDNDTIDVVREVVAEGGPITVIDPTEGDLAGLHIETAGHITMVVQRYGKSSKPLQLNTALAVVNATVTQRNIDSEKVFVVPFDAEDDVVKDLALHVEPLVIRENADVVQAGVQLVNLDLPVPEHASRGQKLWRKLRGWYCVHNCMEYFFWFSSRMFYQVDQGFVPLGGNTVFIKLTKINAIGGWPLSLTEDCAAGVMLSIQENAKVVAAYEPRLATREETPPYLLGKNAIQHMIKGQSPLKEGGGLFGQRERWDQGFVAEWLKRLWTKLAMSRRVQACYILAMPFIQALNGLMIPLAVVAALLLVGPVGLVLIMYAPFVPIAMTICLQLVGLREFSQEFHQKASPRHYLSLVIGNFPFQLVLSVAAISALRRQYRGHHDWRLTQHDGQHRTKTAPVGATATVIPSVKGSVA